MRHGTGDPVEAGVERRSAGGARDARRLENTSSPSQTGLWWIQSQAQVRLVGRIQLLSDLLVVSKNRRFMKLNVNVPIVDVKIGWYGLQFGRSLALLCNVDLTSFWQLGRNTASLLLKDARYLPPLVDNSFPSPALSPGRQASSAACKRALTMV
ncbi:unnamed protein product [Protopolystoma xenopodis]|uniref:Uncharacterized protein n=1 Tax=Protopolystoma xenopodis TaxID=117903 RepID=A0A3S5CUW6_9PLAT|nr:unnamed protein product [Protopolystoma xenopodis]